MKPHEAAMLALAALLFAPLHGQRIQTMDAPPIPVILGRYSPGGLLTVRGSMGTELVFAVWADGRVVWRHPLPTLVRSEDKYRYNEASFYETRADPARVRDGLQELNASGAFELKTWGPPITEAPGVRIRVISATKELHLTWVYQIPLTPPGDESLAVRWELGTRAIDQVLALVEQLRVGPSKEINRPHPSEFESPALKPK